MNWDFYQANVNDKIASLYVDLSLKEGAPFRNLPKLAWYWIKMESPREDGLSSEDEFASLCSHEDALIDYLSKYEARYVGRITTQGRREFYFYLSNSLEVNELLRNFVSEHPDFMYQIGEKEDPGWEQYLNLLYPGPNGLSQINRRNS